MDSFVCTMEVWDHLTQVFESNTICLQLILLSIVVELALSNTLEKQVTFGLQILHVQRVVEQAVCYPSYESKETCRL